MRRNPNGHLHEDVFEEYIFGRLSEDDVVSFEKHLLICEECQAALDNSAQYVQLMKAATAACVRDSSVICPPRFRLPNHSLRRNAAAAAVLLLMSLSALFSWRTTGGDPKPVVLESYRAGSPSTMPQAPAGQPLDLKIDLRDLPTASGYRVEVVDSSGRRVWFGGTPARLTKGLAPGTYWIRLFTESGELLREFGLRAG